MDESHLETSQVVVVGCSERHYGLNISYPNLRLESHLTRRIAPAAGKMSEHAVVELVTRVTRPPDDADVQTQDAEIAK